MTTLITDHCLLPVLLVYLNSMFHCKTERIWATICPSDSIFSTGYKGTGVIIDAEEGIILTVHHVVADANECAKIEVELPGIEDRVPLETVKHCASIDRARLRISPEVLSGLSLQPIYRATAPAQTDQEIYFWGYGPEELRMGAGTVMDVIGENIITDAYAVPGDSGSPVFDEYGHLLGTMSISNRSDRAVFTGDELCLPAMSAKALGRIQEGRLRLTEELQP